jgi:hypothetical protein
MTRQGLLCMPIFDAGWTTGGREVELTTRFNSIQLDSTRFNSIQLNLT